MKSKMLHVYLFSVLSATFSILVFLNWDSNAITTTSCEILLIYIIYKRNYCIFLFLPCFTNVPLLTTFFLKCPLKKSQLYNIHPSTSIIYMCINKKYINIRGFVLMQNFHLLKILMKRLIKRTELKGP